MGRFYTKSQDTAMRVHLFRSVGAHGGCVLKVSYGYMGSQVRAL